LARPGTSTSEPPALAVLSRRERLYRFWDDTSIDVASDTAFNGHREGVVCVLLGQPVGLPTEAARIQPNDLSAMVVAPFCVFLLPRFPLSWFLRIAVCTCASVLVVHPRSLCIPWLVVHPCLHACAVFLHTPCNSNRSRCPRVSACVSACAVVASCTIETLERSCAVVGVHSFVYCAV
jgi:hypothetical protein